MTAADFVVVYLCLVTSNEVGISLLLPRLRTSEDIIEVTRGLLEVPKSHFDILEV